MHKIQPRIADDLPSVLDELYRQFGIWKLVQAIAVAGWRHWRSSGPDRSYEGNNLDDLPDRIRRDIGLGSRPQRFSPPSAPQWERWR